MKSKSFFIGALLCSTGLIKAQFTLTSQFTPPCVPQSGLMAFWPLGGYFQGNDSWGSYNQITYNNVSVSPDRFGSQVGASRFNGTNSYIETGYAGILASNPRAVSFWAKIPSYVGNSMYPVAWGDNGLGERFGCSLDNPATGNPAIGGASCYNITDTYPSGTGSTSDNNWHHYVFQFPGGANNTVMDVEIYMDGMGPLASTGSFNGSTILSTVNGGGFNVHFGKTPYVSAPNFFTGDLDDVGIWDRTLTLCEIRKLHDCSYCCTPDDDHRKMQLSNSPKQTGNIKTNTSTLWLSQNVPNPFDESTTILYSLPADFTSAELILSNTEGAKVKAFNLNGKGNGSITISSADIGPGIYSYALVVDGKTVDIKKMIRE